MSMQGFAGHTRGICVAVIIAFLAALADVPALARGEGDGEVRVTNQTVRIDGDVALISYDLEAPEGVTYIVSVELKRESEPSFSLIPTGLSGDVGEVRTPGPGKLIRWIFLRDFPVGLHGEDYYFRIEVNRPGGFPWLWVGLGTAAAAGAVVAIVSGRGSSSAAQPGIQELPLPPAR